MPPKLNLTGQRFGRLLVICEGPKARPNAGSKWRCVCDCGVDVITETGALRSGHTKSCGCLHRDIMREKSTTHGQQGTPEYRAWAAMIGRCTIKSHSSYRNYGGRGISVCERWRLYEQFREDMGNRPAGSTLDRINTNGNYELENCRWATKEQQDNNKRTSVFVTFEGRTMTYSQWARELGSDPSVLRQRWIKFGTLKPIQRTKESYYAKTNRTNQCL